MTAALISRQATRPLGSGSQEILISLPAGEEIEEEEVEQKVNFADRTSYFPPIKQTAARSPAFLQAYEACEKGNMDVVRMLLYASVPVNQKGLGGNTFLHLSARNQNTRMCLELLTFKADPELENDSGESAFDVALKYATDKPYIADFLRAGLQEGSPYCPLRYNSKRPQAILDTTIGSVLKEKMHIRRKKLLVL